MGTRRFWAIRQCLGYRTGSGKGLAHGLSGRVTGGADLVCFWFDKAREAIEADLAKRAGLVATNSIRGGANRRVLDALTTSLTIFNAWSDQPWAVEGAAVRVSLICFGKHSKLPVALDARPVDVIHSDLTSGMTDLTTARALSENTRVAFNGIQKTGPFELAGDEARYMLVEPLNPNGLSNSAVLKPWWNGIDIVRRNRDMWIVDFGLDEDESRASLFVSPFSYLARNVRPTRVGKREARTNECWWLFQWSRPAMRAALANLERFIVTPEVSKHRFSYGHPPRFVRTRI